MDFSRNLQSFVIVDEAHNFLGDKSVEKIQIATA